jgi:hypothetical protein
MSGHSRRRLTLKRETLRRLGAGELQRVAGGRIGFCTYNASTCQGGPTGGCWTEDCQGPSEDCNIDNQI